MAVRIARIDLDGVQALLTDEGRQWVEQRIPGRAGSLFQQLGRTAVGLRLEGLLLGEDALEKLESLRKAHADAKPVSFSADITSGFDFTDVLIDGLHVRQVAGYKSRYWYRLDVREHVDEPPPAGAALAEVDAGVEADAASWAGDATGAAGAIQDVSTLPDVVQESPGVLDHLSEGDLTDALENGAGSLDGGALDRIASATGVDQGTFSKILDKVKNVQMKDVIAAYNAIKDPSSIPDLLAKNPGMLDRLGLTDLGNAITSKADALTGGQFSKVLQTIGKVDPAKVVKLVNDLRDSGSLGEFLEKLAEDGIDIVGDLTGIDLGDAKTIIEGVKGATEFISKLKAVGEKATALLNKVRAFDPIAPVRALAHPDELPSGTLSSAADIVTSAGDLVVSVADLLHSNTVDAVIALARKLRAQEQINAGVDLLVSGIDEVKKFIDGLRDPLTQLSALSGLVTLSDALVATLAKVTAASGEDLALVGLGAAKEATGPLSKAFGTGSQVLRGGAAVLEAAPTPESLDVLQRDLDQLRESLSRYKGEGVDEADAAAGGAA